MKQMLKQVAMTLVALIALDICVALTLSTLKERGRLSGLTNYFDLGRSVPTKIADWQRNPDRGSNLFDVAWVDDILEHSSNGFAKEAADAQVLRNYGMSFSNRIGEAAVKMRPDLALDSHGGPAAPANHTYHLFMADRKNRRAGDVVMFGVLASSVPYLFSMSNRSWAFEQPAPFTYPKYKLVNGQLVEISPRVFTVENEIALAESESLANAWATQLRHEDPFYSDFSFAAQWADLSPFAKLVRRALVLRDLEDKRAQMLSQNAQKSRMVLMEMLRQFSDLAIADGQIPVVALIQTRGANDVNLRDFLAADLEAEGIPYIATEDWVDPTDPSRFVSDGHYTRETDVIFARALLDKLNLE